jgi:hAT family C-terminal dimerisation region/BED zinc finger
MQPEATQCAADIAGGSRDATPESSSPFLLPPTPAPSQAPSPPASGSPPASTSPAPTRNAAGRQRSWVWRYFTKADDYASSFNTTCTRCYVKLKASRGSTSTMAAHLVKTHGITQDPDDAEFPGGGVAKPRVGLLSPQEAQAIITEWVVCEDLPFTIVESARFRALVRPEISVPSATTLRRRIMARYKEEAKCVVDRVRGVGSKISVTLDCWTSPSQKPFMGITAHYIDKDWALQSFVLDFVPLSGDHTGDNLCNVFAAVCERFDLLPRLLGMATDNASNVNKFLELFETRAGHGHGAKFDKEEQHVRCAAHVINLAVQALLCELGAATLGDKGRDGDDDDGDGDGDDGDGDGDDNCDGDDDDGDGDADGAQAEKLSCITGLRRLVTKVRGSTKRREAFTAECGRFKVEEKELIQDVRTRWNSTYAMIMRALELRVPLCELAKDDPRLSAPSDEEWEILKVVSRVLAVFDAATRSLCASNYPTLNKAVPVYNYLFDRLEGFLGMCDDDGGLASAATINRCSPATRRTIKKAIKKAHAKLRTYYGQTWAGMYAIAVILDPTRKMDYYAENRWGPKDVDHARKALQCAIEEYGAAGGHEAASPQPGSADDEDAVECCDDWTYRNAKRHRDLKGAELERYLAEPAVDRSANVLEWWRTNSEAYPCLARIARDYLAIPATSVPSERVFSGGTDLITSKRGSLKEETIQACMCLASWLQSSL